MLTKNIKVPLRDGEMGAYLAIPDRTPAGAIIAIMEIWGANDTMRYHAHEFAEARFVLAAGARRRTVRRQSRRHQEGFRSLLRVRLRPRRARHGGHPSVSEGSAAGMYRQGRRGRLLPRRQALLPDVL